MLASISRALQLNEAEHAHLVDLVRVANEERPPRRTTSRSEVRPSIRQIVDAMYGIAAFVGNGRADILYANTLFEALYSEMYRDPTRPPNAARFLFLDPRAQTFYPDWDTLVRDSVAGLRSEAGRNPYVEVCPTLSGCSRREARSSGPSGHATTSTCTGAAQSASTTRLSATSPCVTRVLACPRIPAWPS